MDFRKNASGYYDETAYKALTTNPKAGEIWTHNTSGAYMLVVANVGGVCVTLRINDNARDEHSLPVAVRVPMWVNPQFIGYCFNTMLSQFVKLADKDEFEAVKDGIALALDLVAEEESVEESEECGEACDNTEARAELMAAQAKIDFMKEQVCFYREMYEKLLDKALGRAG